MAYTYHTFSFKIVKTLKTNENVYSQKDKLTKRFLTKTFQASFPTKYNYKQKSIGISII